MAVLYPELHRNILDVFDEYGVQIMTPADEGNPVDRRSCRRSVGPLAPARRAAAPDGGTSAHASDA
jgi:hypothetical protein